MFDGAFQVIDRGEQILDEILVSVALRLLAVPNPPFAEILELRLETQGPVLDLGQDGRLLFGVVTNRLEFERKCFDGDLVGGGLAGGAHLFFRRLAQCLGRLAQRVLELGAGRNGARHRLFSRVLAVAVTPPRAQVASFPVSSREQ